MAGGKKHYRVAKKEIEQLNSGIYISEEQKAIVIAIGIAVLLAFFIKGMLVGMLCNRD